MTATSQLNDFQRAELGRILAFLVDADEPQAMLAVLRRLVEHKTRYITRGMRSTPEAARWLALADALARVQVEI